MISPETTGEKTDRLGFKDWLLYFLYLLDGHTLADINKTTASWIGGMEVSKLSKGIISNLTGRELTSIPADLITGDPIYIESRQRFNKVWLSASEENGTLRVRQETFWHTSPRRLYMETLVFEFGLGGTKVSALPEVEYAPAIDREDPGATVQRLRMIRNNKGTEPIEQTNWLYCIRTLKDLRRVSSTLRLNRKI